MSNPIVSRIECIENEIKLALREIEILEARIPPMFEDNEQERKAVFTFIFNILDMNDVKLVDVSNLVIQRYKITIEKAQYYLFETIDNYKCLRDKYLPHPCAVTPVSVDAAVPVAVPVVVPVNTITKKKGPKPYSEMTPDELAAAKAKRAAKASNTDVKNDTTKRVLKKKASYPMKSPALLIWNSFVDVTRSEMETSGVTVSYEDVVKKAVELKKSDPDAYKLFSENWSSDSS